MRSGNNRLQEVILLTYAEYPAIEKQLPAKVNALRRALCDKMDIEFDVPSESNTGPSPDGGYRRCRDDRTILIDSRGRGISRIQITLKLDNSPVRRPAKLTASLAVWEQKGAWLASVEDSAPTSVEDIDALAGHLTAALEESAREVAIDCTKDRGRYDSGAGM